MTRVHRYDTALRQAAMQARPAELGYLLGCNRHPRTSSYPRWWGSGGGLKDRERTRHAVTHTHGGVGQREEIVGLLNVLAENFLW